MTGRFTRNAWAQSSLLDELLNAVEQDPSNIEAQKLLAQHYQTLGWEEAAAEIADSVLALRPTDQEARFIVEACRRSVPSQKGAAASGSAPPPYTPAVPVDTPAANVQNVNQLREEYQSLRDEAQSLLQEMLVFQELVPNADCAEQIADLTALSEGRMYSVARRQVGKPKTAIPATGSKRKAITINTGAPCSARTLASNMKVNPDTALEAAISDFTGAVSWYRENKGGGSPCDTEVVRNALRKRADALSSVLPRNMAQMASEAFMHIEHEVLKKTYVNSETMCSDSVSDIPRSKFWVSEDGYAWDMSELVQAIQAKKGAMRNPLSHENFTTSDVEAIIRHPVGKQLAALQLEQSKLKKGVRQETITRLRSLATVLLQDDSANSHPSHNAVDDFLAYVATLPASEKETIDKLRVPAVDSHSRQPIDDTIGDAVRDAKGNRLCFHKAGDLLRQGAEFLDKSK